MPSTLTGSMVLFETIQVSCMLCLFFLLEPCATPAVSVIALDGTFWP